MFTKLISRRDILRIAACVTSVIATMAASPSIASAGPDNNGLHKGWFKDHDNNGLHKGWFKDHDLENSNNNNANSESSSGTWFVVTVGHRNWCDSLDAAQKALMLADGSWLRP